MTFKIKWHDDLQVILNNHSWQHVFKICFKTLNDPYLKWFPYRIIHRILGTQKLLIKWEYLIHPNALFVIVMKKL